VGLPKSYCRTCKDVCATWMVGRRNTLSPCRIMSFVDLADIRCIKISAYLNMRRIWNDYKVWILIGLAYTGFYFFKGYKTLKQIVSSLYTKLVSLQSLSTKES
jgi:hypothetical protein